MYTWPFALCKRKNTFYKQDEKQLSVFSPCFIASAINCSKLHVFKDLFSEPCSDVNCLFYARIRNKHPLFVKKMCCFIDVCSDLNKLFYKKHFSSNFMSLLNPSIARMIFICMHKRH